MREDFAMTKKQDKMWQPVAPSGTDLVAFYICPACQRKVSLIAPTQPGLAMCTACGTQFPFLPIDDCTVRFLKIMLDDGRACVDPDFA